MYQIIVSIITDIIIGENIICAPKIQNICFVFTLYICTLIHGFFSVLKILFLSTLKARKSENYKKRNKGNEQRKIKQWLLRAITLQGTMEKAYIGSGIF